ncbi:hypothetical protein RRG08_016709 [Elysia crispata]|uniref:Uncharacterized protein n=1 Tax=Elysia crispata TaxID=231223 RepID=A0AAE0ZRR2_9GAST|nr:hypothetical protein RRG08_016709 [Elysia crispata]
MDFFQIQRNIAKGLKSLPNIAHVDRAQLMLQLEAFDLDYEVSTHECQNCLQTFSLTDAEPLDDLSSKLEEVSVDDKLVLFQIGGCFFQRLRERR